MKHRRLSIVLYLLLVCVSPITLESAASCQQASAMQYSDEDLTDVRRFILDDLSSRLKKAMDKDYDSLRAPKAAALCMKWDSPAPRDEVTEFLYFGYAFTDRDTDTRESIDNLALSECNASKGEDPKARDFARVLGVHIDCDCELLLEDSRFVMVPSEAVVRALAAKLGKVTVPTLCAEWFDTPYDKVDPFSRREREWLACPGYTKDDFPATKFVIDELGISGKEPTPNIFPSAPKVRPQQIKQEGITDPESANLVDNRLLFTPPTGEDLYAVNIQTPYTGMVFTYSLNRVPPSVAPSVIAKLNSLVPSKLYGRFSRVNTTKVPLPSFNPADGVARYIRTFDLSDDEVVKALDFPQLPEHGIGIVRGEHSKTMWVECFVPVDQNWVPVGTPLRVVVPIALQTTTSLYLFTEKSHPRQPDSRRYSVEFAFNGRVFDLSKCSKVTDCLKAVERSFSTKLTNSFEETPLSAEPVQTSMPPRQIRMQRLYAESEVLKGFTGPFFELTTYTLAWWNAPTGNLYGTPEFYFTTRKSSDDNAANQLFLNVDMALQIGIGVKSDYPEPTPAQYAAYKKAVGSAVTRAVAETTKELHGTIEDGIGIIRSSGGGQQ
jgi:hypothetical protein